MSKWRNKYGKSRWIDTPMAKRKAKRDASRRFFSSASCFGIDAQMHAAITAIQSRPAKNADEVKAKAAAIESCIINANVAKMKIKQGMAI